MTVNSCSLGGVFSCFCEGRDGNCGIFPVALAMWSGFEESQHDHGFGCVGSRGCRNHLQGVEDAVGKLANDKIRVTLDLENWYQPSGVPPATFLQEFFGRGSLPPINMSYRQENISSCRYGKSGASCCLFAG